MVQGVQKSQKVEVVMVLWSSNTSILSLGWLHQVWATCVTKGICKIHRNKVYKTWGVGNSAPKVTVLRTVCRHLFFWVRHFISLGDHLAECHYVPLGQVPFRKIVNLTLFADFNTCPSGAIHLAKCMALSTHPSNIPDCSCNSCNQS